MASILGGYDGEFVRRAGAILDPLTRAYFRFELRGAERVPRRLSSSSPVS
jgi:hypothetical protein